MKVKYVEHADEISANLASGLKNELIQRSQGKLAVVQVI